MTEFLYISQRGEPLSLCTLSTCTGLKQQQQLSESVLYCATVSCHPICGYGDDGSPDKDRRRIFLRWSGVFEQNWLVEFLGIERVGDSRWAEMGMV